MSRSSGSRAHRITWHTESADVLSHNESSSYAWFDFDGVVFEYYFSRDSNNEKRVDRVDVTYNGATKSLTGDGYYMTRDACRIDQPCEGEMHMTQQGAEFLAFVQSALLAAGSQFNATSNASRRRQPVLRRVDAIHGA